MSGETSDNIELIGEQFRHAVDLIKADTARTQADLNHYREMNDWLTADLKTKLADMEMRLRAAGEVGTQFKFLIALAGTGGVAGLVSLITNLTSK